MYFVSAQGELSDDTLLTRATDMALEMAIMQYLVVHTIPKAITPTILVDSNPARR